MGLGPYVEGALDGPAGAGVVRRYGVAEFGGDRSADPVRTAVAGSEGDGEPVPAGTPAVRKSRRARARRGPSVPVRSTRSRAA